MTRGRRRRQDGDNGAIETEGGSEGRADAGAGRGGIGGQGRGAIDSSPPCRPGTSGAGAAGIVYGLIAVGALLAAESGRHESYLDTFLSALLATLLYWLLHSYAGLLGHRLGSGRQVGAGALARAIAEDRAVLRGAAIPLSALVLAWVAGATQATAVSIALWSTVAAVVAFEGIAGVRAGARGAALMLEVAVGVAMGLAILGLRVILH